MEEKEIKLRKLRISDAEFISACAKNKEITKYTFVIPPPFSIKEAKKFIRKAQQDMRDKRAYEFGIELTREEKLIGTINLLNINYKNQNANIGLWLDEEYWGRGFSKKAVKLMLGFAFNKLKLKRIQARVLHKNTRSQKLLESLGFRLEGKLRKKTFLRKQWFDDLIYGLLKKEYK